MKVAVGNVVSVTTAWVVECDRRTHGDLNESYRDSGRGQDSHEMSKEILNAIHFRSHRLDAQLTHVLSELCDRKKICPSKKDISFAIVKF